MEHKIMIVDEGTHYFRTALANVKDDIILVDAECPKTTPIAALPFVNMAVEPVWIPPTGRSKAKHHNSKLCDKNKRRKKNKAARKQRKR